MRTSRWAAVTLAAASLVIGAGATAAFAGHVAQHPGSRGASANARVASPRVAAATAETAAKTYYVNGDAEATEAAGFVAIDGITKIKCSSTCTLEVDQNVQVLSADASNRWAICLEVDGALTGPCPYLGYAPTDTYGAGTWLQPVSLAAGTHKVQDFVYSDDGVSVYNYSFAYRTFTP